MSGYLLNHFKKIFKSGDVKASIRGFFDYRKKDFAFLWENICVHRKQVLRGVVISLPLAFLSGLMAWIGKNVTQSILDGFDAQAVLFWAVVALAVMMVASVLEVASRTIMTTLTIRITHYIRLRLYDAIQKNSISFHMHYRTGELANLIANDAHTAAAGSIELLSVMLQCPVRILFLLCVMFYFNAFLSLLAIITAPLLAKIIHVISRKARVHEMTFLEKQGQMLGMMIESLTNMRQVKHFGLETVNREHFDTIGNKLIQTRRTATLIKALVSPAGELILGIMLIIMIGISYYQVTHGYTTTAAIVGCLIGFMSLKRPVKALSQSIVELQRAFAAVRRISWTTGIAEHHQDRIVLSAPIESIEFKDVTFSYDGNRPILEGVSLTINGGEHVAVIGPSGAGKTTLSDLINGLYPHSSGEILINGISMTQLDMSSWRNQIGIVSQEPFLFDATIRENVLMGNFSASDTDILNALKEAGCDDMLKRLTDGIDTRVGERGALLSGGERKRVALARIIVRKAALVILDEATSELDSASEQHIIDSIAKWSPRPIIINISHRSSILPQCDRILMVQKRCIWEISHEDAQKFASGSHKGVFPMSSPFREQLPQVKKKSNANLSAHCRLNDRLQSKKTQLS
jgi:ABC-type multidrug transport system fused ATPase/permease subunit